MLRPPSLLLSQIRPPRSHTTPNKMLMEPTAAILAHGSSKTVHQISSIIGEIRRWHSKPRGGVANILPTVVESWLVALLVGRELVRPERFELPTCCSGGNRSIQLSYGRARVDTVYMAGERASTITATGTLKILNHEGHEVTRRKPISMKFFPLFVAGGFLLGSSKKGTGSSIPCKTLFKKSQGNIVHGRES